MRTSLSLIAHRSRSAPRRGAHPSPSRPAAAPPSPERRARDAGGPIDLAQYGCDCGLQFRAPVSTSVACPHCGAAQTW